jgi:hemoglobin-like flavoprotein
MTPNQITIVESTLERARVDLAEIAADFYRRLFEAEPRVRDMFTSDPAEQRQKFADQLHAIGRAIRDCDTFTADAAELGLRHREYGVRPGDYALAGPPLLEALAATLGPEWTDEVETAWLRAYNLTVEAMMAGASERSEP